MFILLFVFHDKFLNYIRGELIVVEIKKALYCLIAIWDELITKA
jgi:hypothetical protein